MNKSELTAIAAEKAGIAKKDAERLVNALFDTVSLTLAAGDKVQLSGFGTFEVREREPRVGRNPHTKEAIEIPATTVPTFKPSKSLRDMVSK
mgnify:CR=1 FL=1